MNCGCVLSIGYGYISFLWKVPFFLMGTMGCPNIYYHCCHRPNFGHSNTQWRPPMATFSKYEGKGKTTWTAKVRKGGRYERATFPTKKQAEEWCRNLENDIVNS